jgi:hypothetical protein
MRRVLNQLVDTSKPDKIPTLKNTLKNIATKAYKWSYNVNTGYLNHDFRPHFFPPNAEFNSQEMENETKSSTRSFSFVSKSTEKIIASVGLGLKSSAARGPDQGPE